MGSGWRGPDPDIRPELDKIHLIIEGHGRSFPDTRLIFQVKKVMGVGWWPVGLLSAPVPVPLLWHLDSGFRILDFGPGFGT